MIPKITMNIMLASFCLFVGQCDESRSIREEEIVIEKKITS